MQSAIILKKASSNFSQNLEKDLENEFLPSSFFINIVSSDFINKADFIIIDLSILFLLIGKSVRDLLKRIHHMKIILIYIIIYYVILLKIKDSWLLFIFNNFTTRIKEGIIKSFNIFRKSGKFILC